MFSVEDVVGKGKGAVAVCDIPKGTVILSCDPLFALVDDFDSVCSWCFVDCDPFGPPMRRKCKQCCARFCSDRCLELARSRHENFDCFIPSGNDDEDFADVQSVVAVHRLRSGEKAKLFDSALCWQKELDLGRLDRVASKASKVLGVHVSVAETEVILGKVKSNSFGLDSPMRKGEFNESGEPDVNFLGHAVYEEASFFNHTCERANVVRIRRERTLSFVCVRDVDKGEELCITYINSARHKDTNERQALLFELYGFHCDCRVCKGQLKPLDAMCARCGCCEFLEGLCCVCESEKIAERLIL